MLNSLRPRWILTAGLCLAALVAGCSDATGVPMTHVSLFLTDAPGDIQAAVVTIDRIELIPGDGDPLTDDGGKIILREEDLTVDLLHLADSTALIVDNALIPQGRYHEVRFVVSGAYLAVEGEGGATRIYASSPDYAGLPEGTTVDGELRLPSYASSGLKIKLPAGLAEAGGDGLWALLDFDVAESFGRGVGQGDVWVMHPVIRATAVEPPLAPPQP